MMFLLWIYWFSSRYSCLRHNILIMGMIVNLGISSYSHKEEFSADFNCTTLLKICMVVDAICWHS